MSDRGSSLDGTSRRQLRNRRLIHAGFSSIVVRILSGALGLVSVPLALSYLGKDDYGLWMVMTSVVAWFALGDLGITRALQNAISEAVGRGLHEDVPSLAFTGFVGLTAVALVMAIGAAFAATQVPWQAALALPASAAGKAPEAFIATAALFILGLPLSIAASALVALQQTHRVNWLQLIAVALSLIGLLAAIRAELSLGWVIFLGSVGPLPVAILLWRDLGRQLAGQRILAITNFRWTALAKLARSSGPVLAFQVGALAVNQAVVVILARSAGLATVTDYSVVMKLYVFLFSIGSGISIALAPAVREAYESRDRAWARQATMHTVLVRISISAILALPLLVIGDWLVRTWTRQPLDPPLGVAGWAVVAACMLTATASSAISDVLIGLDDTGRQVAMVMLTALIVLPGVLVFAPQWGVIAVFGAMAASTVVPLAYSSCRLRSKLLEA